MPRLFDSSKPDALSNLFNLSKRCPLLKKDEERKLIKLAQDGDQAAMTRLIGSNVGFMLTLARCCSNSVPLEDLMMECCIGCIDAVRKFDLTRDTRLTTYIELLCRTPLAQAKRQANVLRSLSNHMRRFAHDVEVAETRLTRRLNREPEIEELAEELDVSTDTIVDLRQAMSPLVFLDHPTSEDDSRTPYKKMSDQNISPEQAADVTNALQTIRPLLRAAIREELHGRLQEVIRRRFLTHDQELFTTISRDYGVTGEAIRQNEIRALNLIYSWLARNGHLEQLKECYETLSDTEDLPGFKPIQAAELELTPD